MSNLCLHVVRAVHDAVGHSFSALHAGFVLCLQLDARHAVTKALVIEAWCPQLRWGCRVQETPDAMALAEQREDWVNRIWEQACVSSLASEQTGLDEPPPG